MEDQQYVNTENAEDQFIDSEETQMGTIRSRIAYCVLSAQSKEIIKKVRSFMELESKSNRFVIPVNRIEDRVKAATGVSRYNLHQILKEYKDIENGITTNYSSYTEENCKNDNKKISAKRFQHISLLRQIIHRHIIKDNSMLSFHKISKEFEKETEIKISKSDLCKNLRRIGFEFRTDSANRKIIIERHSVRSERLQYLRRMLKYRKEERPIIYVGAFEDLKIPIVQIQKLVIVHAGWENGFLPNAMSTFKTNCVSFNYLRKLTSDVFLKYVEEKLIPNLPPTSVVVLNNLPYTKSQRDPVPSFYSRKEVMQKWLKLRNIYYDSNMLKPDLYEIIKKYHPKYKCYTVDELLLKHGFEVIRLPNYHNELNSLEQMWKLLQEYIKSLYSKKRFLRNEDVKKSCEEWISFREARTLNWAQTCSEVQKIEDQYLINDKLIDDIMDNLSLNSLLDDSSSENENCDSFDNFNEYG